MVDLCFKNGKDVFIYVYIINSCFTFWNIFSKQTKVANESLVKRICKALWTFFYQGFLHRHWRFTGQQRKGRNHLLFHSTTSTRSQTLRHLFATLHVRWLSRIFNRNACVYQTATRWDLPPYRITIWVIDWWCNVCFFYLMNWFYVSVTGFDIGNR